MKLADEFSILITGGYVYLVKNVNLEINAETEILVDFELVNTKKGYDFDVTKLVFQDNNGEFFLSAKPYNTQEEYLRQASEAVDAYLSKNHHEMLIQASDDEYLQFLTLKGV